MMKKRNIAGLLLLAMLTGTTMTACQNSGDDAAAGQDTTAQT